MEATSWDAFGSEAEQVDRLSQVDSVGAPRLKTRSA